MAKAKWGAKQQCPKCATRFYDLGNDNPATCINEECGEQFIPETALKSKQPLPYTEVEKSDTPAKSTGVEDNDDDLAIVDDDEVSIDNEVDLGGDEDLGVATEVKDGDEDN